ncbi:single-stranded-DNA-specific exonuclease RecJ-like protein [Marinobacter sp.]|uniref:single-stranded-DNA-specific exonuclease RecJ-like protein n=1 Tax=Marinobacter sp. TaxID=50741 RepID=UPI00257A0D78|nr:single-stranded-DNA-specific exonuclease RecJ-like protein [Marinobacter sp.]
MGNTINDKIRQHMKVRDGKDLNAAIESVKERILSSRVNADDLEVDTFQLDDVQLNLAADSISKGLLSGSRVLLLGRANPDHILSISTFIRSLNLLLKALRRTRDVVQTTRGSFNEKLEEFEARYFCSTFTSERLERESEIEDVLANYGPNIIIVLDPTKGILARIRESSPASLIIALATNSCLSHISDCDIAIMPRSGVGEMAAPKNCTLCAIAYQLSFRCRDTLIGLISAHARVQALTAQIKTAGLEASDTLVALSYLCDDMPMKPHVRDIVGSGVDRINRGWTQQSRTSHSRGTLLYGLRALLIEVEAAYPFTAQQVQMRLIPLFSSVCYSGCPETLIDCLLCDELKVSKEKASKASILKAKTYFPSLKQLAGLIGAEPLGAPAEKVHVSNPIEYEESNFENDSRLLPIFAERRYADSGKTQLVSAAMPNGLLRCFLRSDFINVNDALRFISFDMNNSFYPFQFWADAFSGDVAIEREAFPEFKSRLDSYLARMAEVSNHSSPNIVDGPLSVNQRTSALAQWLERQPWGRTCPEPVFEQCFVVRNSTVLMETHQSLLVDDCNANERGFTGEGFVLIWKNSAVSMSERLGPGQKVVVRYRLRLKRDASSTNVFGEVVSVACGQTGELL